MVKNLLPGWWGTISLIVTPIYAVQNVTSYVAAMHELRGAQRAPQVTAHAQAHLNC